MINEEIKSWNYYRNKLPLYIKNSYGLEQMIKDVFYDCLKRVDEVEDDFLEVIDILNENYSTILEKYVTPNDSSEENSFDILVKIAKIYGMNREINISYMELNEETQVLEKVEKKLTLTNEELLKLIKGRILQNNFNGSYEQMRAYYDYFKLPIFIYTDTDIDLKAHVIISTDGLSNFTQNEVDMIKAGLFTLKSMGIEYDQAVVDTSNLFIWDESLWDSQEKRLY